MSEVLTRVGVQLALHRLGQALQLDGLQGAVGVDDGGQAAQRLPHETGHLPHGENLQELVVNRRERSQEHRLANEKMVSNGKKRRRSSTCRGKCADMSTCLRLRHRTGAFVFLREEEANGHEELVDADAELLFVLASRRQGEEAAGLDDVLEDVLAGLRNSKGRGGGI